MTTANSKRVFDYRALRLLMGIVTIALPVLVTVRSSSPLSSISASYYTEARDLFVGLLFFVAAFLCAYNGHTVAEFWASKGACVAAILVAIYPTACDSCASSPTGTVHYLAAAALFGILAYFCLFPFRVNTKGQKGKKGRRDRIYVICGSAIIVCLLGALIAKLAMPDTELIASGFTFWAEWGALWSFGFAWLVAGKSIDWLVDKNEKYKIKLFG